jgi:RNA polymerase sigma-70 factor (ECF subfamily)
MLGSGRMTRRTGTVPMDVSDEVLVERAQRGETKAYAMLVDRWADRAYNLALRMLKNVEDAEDAVQEAFLKAYRALPRFRGGSAFGTWFYRIVTNTALLKMRRSAREVFVEVSDEPNGRRIPEGLVDWTDTPLERLLNQETRELMDEAIEALPLDQRTVFVLRDVDGLPAGEVADVLGLSVPAVKSRLHRARVQLRDQLGSYFREKTDSGRGSLR